VRLAETRLRSLIRDVLLEGYREDVEQLKLQLEGDAESIATLAAFPPDWVAWISNRYIRQTYPHSDTLKDVLPVLRKFYQKYKLILQTYKDSANFRSDIDALRDSVRAGVGSKEIWESPAEFKTMSSSSMDSILALHGRHKERGLVDRRSEAWKSDKIGQFGPWALYFPTNQQNSINIAGADPVTLKGHTTWCTARTAGSNLFYNYAGRGIMLFYAIDESKQPTDPKGRISLGFARGKLHTRGDDGGITVDAANRGLKMPDLERIFGGHLGPILSAAESVIQRHGGSHPAKAELEAAAADPAKFAKMLRGLSDEEAGDLAGGIMRHAPTAEVVEAAARHKSVPVRVLVASNKNAPPSMLEHLAGDPNEGIRYEVACNRSTPPSVLKKLAGDSDALIRWNVAAHKKTPTPALEKLAGDPNVGIRRSVAVHKKTSPSALERLAGDDRSDVRAAVASNQNIPAAVLVKMAQDVSEHVRGEVAKRRSLPLSVLAQLASDRSATVRAAAASNQSMPSSALERLAGDPDAAIRCTAAGNSRTPSSALARLASDPDGDVRLFVARNLSTPVAALEKLQQSRNVDIRKAVIKTLAALSQVRESRHLALKIIAELKRR